MSKIINCEICHRVIIDKPRTSNGLGTFCSICVPNCKTCGHPVNILHANRCNLCWEVEHRLQAYLKSYNARTKVKRILDNYL